MKNTKMLLVLGMAGCLMVAIGVAQTRPAADLYQEALHQQEVKGDLGKAIEIYRTIVDRYPSDQAIAPKALLEMARGYETLGRPEAADVYQRILREYPGSRAADASRSAAALGAAQQLASGPVARQLKDTDLESISPDGRYAALQNKNGNLVVRDIASGRERVIASCEPADECWVNEMLFSPDSRLIVYATAVRAKQAGPRDPWPETLRVISRDGGQPRVVYSGAKATDILIPCGWTPDGKFILANIEGDIQDLMLIPANGGMARLVRRFEVFTGEDYFKMSPDGRTAAYDSPAAPGKPERDLFSIALDTGRETRLLTHPADDRVLGWFPDGERILFSSDRGGTYSIWAARVVDGRAQGEPLLIRRDTGNAWPLGFSRKGDFYYGVGDSPREVYVATLDATTGRQAGSLTRIEGRQSGGKTTPAWSPDGDRIAYAQSATSGMVPSKKLAIQTVSTGEVNLLSLSLRNFENPVWLPNGRDVMVQGNNAEQGQGLFRVNIETGALTSILKQGGLPAVSPDGQRVFYSFAPAPGQRSIVARDLVSGAEQTVSTQPFNRFALSPDGRWLAVTQLQASPNGSPVSVIPASGGEPRPLASVVSSWSIGPAVTWSRDGRYVFVVKILSISNSIEIWQVPVDGGEPRHTGISWSGQGATIDSISAHPDGRRLALSTSARSWTFWVLQNLPAQAR